MKLRLTVSVIVLFGIVAAIFFRLNPQDTEVSTGSLPASMRLLPVLKENPIVWMQVQNLEKNEVVTLEHSQGGWKIKFPVSYPADDFLVDGLAASLRLASKARRLTPEKDWEEYGLLKPALKIGIQMKNETKRRYLYFGDSSPVGDFIFARWEGEAEYFLLDKNMKRAFDHSLYSMRRKQIFRLPLQEIARMRIVTSSQEYEISKKNRQWVWTFPPAMAKTPLSKTQSDEILTELSNLYVKDFLDKEKHDPVELGFSLKSSSIKVATQESGKMETLRLGNEWPERDSYYGLREGEDLYFLVARDNVRHFFEIIETFAKQ